MNKKVLILASLCAFGLCTWEAQAVNLEDSYAGLGYSYCQPSESPVHWDLEFIQGVMREQQVGHHFMTVDYGKTNIAQVHIEY